MLQHVIEPQQHHDVIMGRNLRCELRLREERAWRSLDADLLESTNFAVS